MFRLSYQGKNRLKKLGIFLGILAALVAVVLLCAFIWLQRYIVYTRDGVKFDFDRNTLDMVNGSQGNDTQRETMSLDIYINDGQEEDKEEVDTGKLVGVYADTAMLLDSVTEVQEALAEADKSAAVLLDVKSKFGNYYYTTTINGASQSDSISAPEMDELIASLRKSDHHLIARLPAFRDSAFALENIPCGLPLASGYLWTDEDKCYWLYPTKTAVLDNLVQICRELQDLGFDEVVFSDFLIPDSGKIAYRSDVPKDDAIRQAAEYLVDACAGEYFIVSFIGTTDFPLPDSPYTRLYLADVPPEQAEQFYANAPGADPVSQTVFLASTRDTRFEQFSHLRPLK